MSDGGAPMAVDAARLAGIEARARAATEGPWHDDGYRVYGPTDAPDKRSGPVLVEHKHLANENGAADGAFIAHARVDVPDMAAALRAAWEIIDGSADPPTEAEIDAHAAAGGGWLVTYTTRFTKPGIVHVAVLHDAEDVRRHLSRAYRNCDDTRTLRWGALDTNGVPCARRRGGAAPGTGASDAARLAQFDAAVRRLVRFEKGASHAHGRCAVWDPDNGAIAGQPCARCHAFADARELVGEARWRVHPEPARADPADAVVACNRADCGCAKGGAP